MITDIYTDRFTRIKHDSDDPYLIVHWVGRQTKESVKNGCMQMLHSMTTTNIFYILNDNRHVIGTWEDVAEWVGAVWLPLMKDAGLQKFAWVQSVLSEPQASTELTLTYADNNEELLRTFRSYASASTWLYES